MPINLEAPLPGNIPAPARLSFSQASTYRECGFKWLGSYGYKLKSAPYWASVAGSAIHSWTEAFDRRIGEPPKPDEFSSFLEQAAREESSRSGFKVSEFRASGAARADGTKPKGRSWWEDNGPEMCSKYADWREGSDLTLLPLSDEHGEISATNAIERKVSRNMAGIPFVGFIDRVLVDESQKTIYVMDIKTNTSPPNPEQLVAYAIQMEDDPIVSDMLAGGYQLHGMYVKLGYVKDAQARIEYVDLSAYDLRKVEREFNTVARSIMAGLFITSPSNFCGGCAMKDYCHAVGGTKSHLVPDVVRVIPTKRNLA